jgi:putative endonuclease
MHHVYLLKSLSDTRQRYVGLTSRAVADRLAEHNAGQSIHTSKFKPWACVVSISFEDQAKAEAFEIYLKHGSGHAFANKHFW